MSRENQFDVIIIGTGAGGGTLAYHLAPSGKRILILERGDYVAREKDNWSPQAVNVDAKYNTKEAWRDVDGKELHPHTNYFVGGNTKFYGAALFRLRKEDFAEIRRELTIVPAVENLFSGNSPLSFRFFNDFLSERNFSVWHFVPAWLAACIASSGTV